MSDEMTSCNDEIYKSLYKTVLTRKTGEIPKVIIFQTIKIWIGKTISTVKKNVNRHKLIIEDS